MTVTDNKWHAPITAYFWPVFFLLACLSFDAHAEIDNAGLMTGVLDRYASVASTWSAVITRYASWLFWTLALISLVWTFGMLALKHAEVGEFIAETMRFTMFTGFFWWLLTNGPNFAVGIMDSLRQIAAEATGLGSQLQPSGIVDIGFQILTRVLAHTRLWDPVESAVGILVSLAILVVMALIAVNMLILLISGWVLAYAGVFFLGFGGSRWTSEMAIGYFKTTLSVAAQLFTMVLLVGIGQSFVDQYYSAMTDNKVVLSELGVMLIVSVVLLMLVTKVPPLIGSLGGAHTGAIGSGFGVGAAVGAAAMGAAAAATAGAAAVAGAANIGGGAQALMTAFSQAKNAEGSDGAAGNLLSSAGGEGGGSDDGIGSSPLASAMGDDDTGGSLGSAANSSSFADTSGGGSAQASSSSGSAAGGGTSSSAAAGSPGEVKSGGALAAAGSMAAKAGRIAAGTASNLAHGSWDVAKEKGGSLKVAALNRIAETPGGKIAAAINARAEAGKTVPQTTPPDTPTTPNTPDAFDGNSLSGGDTDEEEAASKIAAFRNGDSRSA